MRRGRAGCTTPEPPRLAASRERHRPAKLELFAKQKELRGEGGVGTSYYN